MKSYTVILFDLVHHEFVIERVKAEDEAHAKEVALKDKDFREYADETVVIPGYAQGSGIW